MTWLDVLLLMMVGICLYTDIKEQKIYNKVLLPALTLGLIGNAMIHGLPGLMNSFLGFLLGMALLIFPFIAGGIGAGDVKLMGVIGIIKGPIFVFQAFLMTAIVGGVIAIIVLTHRKVMGETFRRLATAFMSLLLMIPRGAVMEGLQSPRAIVFPYGIAISIGTFLAYFNFLG